MMALFEFRDLSGNLLVEFTRGPSFPLGRGIVKNVVAGETLGGFVRAEVRGVTRKRYHLRCVWQAVETFQRLNIFLPTYAGQAAAFYFIGDWKYFDGLWTFNGSDYPWWGGRLRVRLLDPVQEVPMVMAEKSEYECTLIEDLV
jgi:hypothetical protein